MAGFTKESSIKIKKVGSDVNSIPMEIFILAIFLKIKNMAKVPSTGLVFALQLALKNPVRK